MSGALALIAERQIQKAIAEGRLQGLPGEGKPLPDLREAPHVDVTTRIANRILAGAGALPEEIRLKKLLDAARAAWRSASTDEEKRSAMALIARLDLRHALAAETRRRFGMR